MRRPLAWLVALAVLGGGGAAARQARPGTVAANGVALASPTIDLPADEGVFPGGTEAELVTANCTACHSASMALGQPPLSAAQWRAEVAKMREAYHAPIDEKDVPAIVAYLTMIPGQRPAETKQPNAR